MDRLNTFPRAPLSSLAERIGSGDGHAESDFLHAVMPGLSAIVRDFLPHESERPSRFNCKAMAYEIAQTVLQRLRLGEFTDFEETIGLLHAQALEAVRDLGGLERY